MCSRNFSTAVERTGGNSRVMASCTANYIRLRGRGRGVEKEPLFRTQRDTNEVNTRHTHKREESASKHCITLFCSGRRV